MNKIMGFEPEFGRERKSAVLLTASACLDLQ
jgi:hypothetical protein